MNGSQSANNPDESQLSKINGLGRSVPKTEEPLQVILPKTMLSNRRSEKYLNGLYEVLPPGSTVIKDDHLTYVIEESDKLPVTVRKSDVAENGTKTKKTPHQI